MAKLIQNTYAEALFEASVEENSVDAVFDDVSMLKRIFTENPEYTALFNNPRLTCAEKQNAAESVLKGKANDLIVGLINTMLTHDRMHEIIKVFESFENKFYDYKKIGIVSVTSAVPLSEAQKKKIEERLKATTDFVSFEITYAVVPEIIGGLVIRIGDRVVDSSIKTKIERLSESLKNASLS